jgi:hypothetical protein
MGAGAKVIVIAAMVGAPAASVWTVTGSASVDSSSDIAAPLNRIRGFAAALTNERTRRDMHRAAEKEAGL